MAKSFKAIIESVVEEISLCGDQGALPAEVLSFFENAYATPSRHPVEAGLPRVPKVDHLLKCKLWTWLTGHPEVSVGKNREGNDLTLDEIIPSKLEPDAIAQNIDPSLTAESQEPQTQSSRDLRVFVSQERMWRAITGHGPDKQKVLPLEFALLSIIASHKSRGIVQGDLVQLSGQDKRSVPGRTDALQAKGYIDKKAIQYKGARTSLCILRKFARCLPAEISQAVRSENERDGNPQADEIIDFGVLLDKLFQCLREKKVITRNDLKNHLGMTDSRRSMVLRKAIRKLEAIGCVRRVEAISYDVMQSYASIMLVREPTEKDIELFHDDSTAVIASLQQEGFDSTDVQSQAQDERMDDLLGSSIVEVADRKQNIIQTAGRKIPQWTPDESLPHLLFNLVDQAGTRGMDNIEIASSSMGSFFRRPIEAVLARFVDSWQYTQPLHLRHLSLIRDTALRGTISYFVQYSFENFEKLVKDGKASWEAVQTPVKKKAGHPPPIEAQPKLDEHGFVVSEEYTKLVKQGNATLRECLEAAKPSNYVVTSHDPVAVQLRDGTYGVLFDGQLLTPGDKGELRHPDDNSLTEFQGRELIGVKRTASDARLLGEADSLGNIISARQAKKRKQKDDPQQMSELDQLKAKGYDETWILYSALVLERPTPGLYLTPIGKRRAHGKRQGRAGKGRIAIFKFPRLREFDWFVETDHEAIGTPVTQLEKSPTRPCKNTRSLRARKASRDVPTDRTQSEAEPTARNSTAEPGQNVDSDSVSSETNRADEDACAERPFKRRKLVESESTTGPGLETPSATFAKPRRDRPPKKRNTATLPQSCERRSTELLQIHKRRGGSEYEEERRNPDQEDQTAERATTANATLERNKAHELILQGSTLADVEQQQGFHKFNVTEILPVNAQRDQVNVETGEHEAANTYSDSMQEPGLLNPDANGRRVGKSDSQVSSRPLDEVEIQSTPKNTAQMEIETRSSRGARKVPIAGSITFLRRKIVMDVVEQCGGAYPMGTELWYPFATAWLKERPEKPDMRTVKGAVRALVDAGKLRQFTFSGKNPKGLMVTKSIIARPEIELTDPLILELQSAVLAADPQLYFHPKAEIDPYLRKTGKGLAAHPLKLPAVEEQVQVMLDYVPAPPRPRLPKPARSRGYPIIQDGRSFVSGSPDFRPAERNPKVRRLKSQQGRPSTSPFLDSLSVPLMHESALSSLMTPSSQAGYSEFRFGATWRPSLMSLIMAPPQTLNMATKTFGTGVCYAPKPCRSYRKIAIAPKKVPVPESLEDILSASHRRNVDFSHALDPASMSFFFDVDIVKNWELRYEDLLDPVDRKLRYIDHTVPGPFESAPLEGPIRFDIDQPALQQRRTDPAITRQAFFRDMEYFRQNPSSRRLAQLQESITASQNNIKPILRRSRYPKDFPQRVAQRLTMAIVVVRALAGGLEGKLTDWPFVASIFPEYDSKYIQDRGKSILSRHRLQLAKMQRDFQEQYLEAYENDLVPGIDYNDLDGYDWGAVVTWAEEQLGRPSLRKAPSLPATQEQFDSIFSIRTEPMLDIDELYQHNAQATIPRKRTLYASLPFAVSVDQRSAPAQSDVTMGIAGKEQPAERLQVAKTWVRANVVTPEETYRPAHARQVLERFGEDLIGQAIQSLTTERVIFMGNRGKVVPGRNFDITEHFLHAFNRKRSIEAAQLRRAKHFKLNILDPAIQAAGKYKLAYDAEDGDMLVLLNMLAGGRVTMWSINPPRNKYGLTDKGYLTRSMDKRKLRFDMEIRPVEDQYVFGDPLVETMDKTPIPNAGLNEDVLETLTVLPRVPLWIDVHGSIVKLLWDLVVAAVVGLVATRPGSGADVIGRVMQPFLGAWEVEMVLQWLSSVGAIRRVRNNETADETVCESWTVQEWWYLALAC